jgi:hypothetical protein
MNEGTKYLSEKGRMSGEKEIISELSKLTMDKIRKRIEVLDVIIDKAIELEDEGVEGSNEEIMEMAITKIGEEKINRKIDEYWSYVKNLERQAIKLGTKLVT